MKKSFFLLLILLVTLSSCEVFKDIEVNDIKDVRINSFDKDGLEAEIDVEVFNPNGYKVQLVSSDVMLYVNDQKAGKVKLMERVVIPKKSREVQTVKVYSDLSEIGSGFWESLISVFFMKKAKVKVEGDVRGKALLVGKSVYINVEQDVELDF